MLFQGVLSRSKCFQNVVLSLVGRFAQAATPLSWKLDTMFPAGSQLHGTTLNMVPIIPRALFGSCGWQVQSPEGALQFGVALYGQLGWHFGKTTQHFRRAGNLMIQLGNDYKRQQILAWRVCFSP